MSLYHSQSDEHFRLCVKVGGKIECRHLWQVTPDSPSSAHGNVQLASAEGKGRLDKPCQARDDNSLLRQIIDSLARTPPNSLLLLVPQHQDFACGCSMRAEMLGANARHLGASRMYKRRMLNDPTMVHGINFESSALVNNATYISTCPNGNVSPQSKPLALRYGTAPNLQNYTLHHSRTDPLVRLGETIGHTSSC